jgi:hypothetical protein
LLYEAALLKADAIQMPSRITVAKKRLVARLRTLTTSAEDEIELFAIEKALRSLAVLEKQQLKVG